MYNRSLFIGRFQPFHNGHFWLLKKALETSDEVIIGIGSAEDNFLKTNPLTCSERMEMILSVMKEKNIPRENFLIIPVRNIGNYDLWVKHTENLTPKFEAIFTGSKIVKNLFEREKKYKVHYYHDEVKELKISATQIREKVINDNKSWKDLVPGETMRFLEKLDFKKRLATCD